MDADIQSLNPSDMPHVLLTVFLLAYLCLCFYIPEFAIVAVFFAAAIGLAIDTQDNPQAK